MNQTATLLNPADVKLLPALKVREFHHPSVFETLSREWNELSSLCSIGSPFLTATCQQLWWGHWHKDRHLRILVLQEENGRLSGIAPLCTEHSPEGRSLALIGCRDLCDYLDFIVMPGFEDSSYAALISHLISTSHHHFSFEGYRVNSSLSSLN